MNRILEKVKTTHILTKKEIIELLNGEPEELFQAADEVRRKYIGDEVHLRGLIEFSNICKQNCLYCGLRRDNTNLKRYRLSEDEILNFTRNAVKQGFTTIVLQSGEENGYNIEQMTRLISKIKALDVAITLSVGEKTYEEYKAYKEAGADRYLLRIETTDRDLYTRMHPIITTNWGFDNRIKCLNYLRELGYEVGTGCLVGLPEQTIESLANDILFFKEINADMIGIGPFIPNEDTPLKDSSGENLARNLDLALKVMAITRLILPDINIPATTAMETLNPNGRIIALKSGANVIMPNVTEGEYRKLYQIYPGKIAINETPTQCTDNIKQKLASIGRTISDSYGYRKRIL